MCGVEVCRGSSVVLVLVPGSEAHLVKERRPVARDALKVEAVHEVVAPELEDLELETAPAPPKGDDGEPDVIHLGEDAAPKGDDDDEPPDVIQL